MLFEILATVFAFITVILLLSLVVTGLTQLVTSALRLRIRNLRRALTILINDALGGSSKRKDVRPYVEDTLDAANFGTTNAPKDMIRGLGLIRVAEIKSEDLIDCLKTAGIALTPELAERTLTNFKRLETYMEKRFALFARYITFGLAAGVAVVFQVSAPDLMTTLWTDPETRAKYVEAGEQLQAQDEASDAEAPEAPATETDEDLEKAKAAGAKKRAEAQGALATLDITPLRYGWKWYRKGPKAKGCLGLDWTRIAGVLVTALLLTFGAPFWFERLKDVARLRDAASFHVGF